MKKQVRNIAIAGTAAAIVIFGFVLPKTNAQDNEAMYRSYVEETTDEEGRPVEEVNVMKLENGDKEESLKGKGESRKDEGESLKEQGESRKDKEESLKGKGESRKDEGKSLKGKGESSEKTVSKKKVSMKKEAIEPIMFSRAMHFKDYDKELVIKEKMKEAEGLEVDADEPVEEIEGMEKVTEAEVITEEYVEVEAPEVKEEVTVSK